MFVDVEQEKEFSWFIVQTQPMKEVRAKRSIEESLARHNLTEYVPDILIPTQNTIEHVQGKTRKITKKIFPRYLIVQMRSYKDVISLILASDSVLGFLGESRYKPTPLHPVEAEHILQLHKIDKCLRQHTNFQIGQIVRIIDGPFSEFKGSIKNINHKKGSCVLDVYIFGRATPVELSFLQIEQET